MNDAPIGIFDSGVGGISVLKDIRQRLPYERLIYMADSAWCPYGSRSSNEIRQRAQVITEWLRQHNVKLIVVACNTATIAAVEWLRSTYPISFIGMEPAVKPAVQQTASGVVGILATGAALAGEKFHHLVSRYANSVRVLTQPCPGLVECVESGDLAGPQTRELVQLYTQPLIERGADTLVLGCTHYPFLRPIITETVGSHIQLIDTGAAVARQVQRILQQEHTEQHTMQHHAITWYTSGNPATLEPIISRLWGESVIVQQGPA